MWVLALLPFFLQAIAIGIDEAYFHYKRGLPLWEKIGHPIDTFGYLICITFILFAPCTDTNVNIYIALSVLSCLLVTKDEFIHKHHCPGSENWLHALLFILHPLVLIMAGLVWPIIQVPAAQTVELPSWLAIFLEASEPLRFFLTVQAVLITLFFLYQVIFWNIIWKNRPVIKM